MIPKTPELMYSLLLRATWTRLYDEITLAARRKRLTEHDIAMIEKRVLALLGDPQEFAAEFPDFDAREVNRMILAELQQTFVDGRIARAKQIAKEQ